MGTFDGTVLETGVWNSQLMFNTSGSKKFVKSITSEFTSVVSTNGANFETATRMKMILSLDNPIHKLISSV